MFHYKKYQRTNLHSDTDSSYSCVKGLSLKLPLKPSVPSHNIKKTNPTNIIGVTDTQFIIIALSIATT